MESKRRPIFMTDSTVSSLKHYFEKNSCISYETLKQDYHLTPPQIDSLVLSDYLKAEGKGKNARFYPGKLWETTGVVYRYGSQNSKKAVKLSKIGEDLEFLAYRKKEDYDRGWLFRIGDIVSKSWGNAPAGLGVVVDVQPVNRKVKVRWPFGTYQEHVDELTLIPRDSGDRQISQPLVNKDIMGMTPEYFDPVLYQKGREKGDSYSNLQKDSFSSSKKASKRYKKYSSVSKKRLSKIANVLIPKSQVSNNLNQDYILSQAEIVVSVNTEKGNPRYKHRPWYITPETSGNVNDNGDAWTSDVLKNTYKTFTGAYNFYEHEQIVSASKGRVVDSLLRKVPLGNGKHYYAVEILVATNKKNKRLSRRIENGELHTLSMGCTCTFTQCSQCGHISYSPENKCAHLRYNKGGFFFDEYGVKRVVAELCGHANHPDSVEFEEASWVEIPAWRNARVHNIINPSTNVVNVVGYLATRLYDKDSVEIMLEDGKFKDIKLKVKKNAAEDNMGFDDIGMEEDGEGLNEEEEEQTKEPEKEKNFEFYEEDYLDYRPSTGKQLTEENLFQP